MKKTISLFLSIVMLFCALTASVNAYAARLVPSNAKRVEFNTYYTRVLSASDPEWFGDYRYHTYSLEIPTQGSLEIYVESSDSKIVGYYGDESLQLYTSRDLDNCIWRGDYNSNQGYDYSRGVYYHSEKVTLSSGSYFLFKPYSGDYVGSYNIVFKYSPAIARPSGFKVKSRNTSSINLTWNKVGGATGYHLQRKINGSYSFVTNTSKNYYNVTGLRAGIRYDFRIRTFVEINGTRYYSGWTYFQTPTKPNKPAIKAPKTNWNDDIIIYWNKVSACSGYQVQYSRTSNFSKISYTKYTSYRNSSFTGHNFWYGYRYYVRVRAYKEVNGVKCFGAWSDSRSIVCQ